MLQHCQCFKAGYLQALSHLFLKWGVVFVDFSQDLRIDLFLLILRLTICHSRNEERTTLLEKCFDVIRTYIELI